ncbi:hypothetical protein [Chryseobacterium soli]|nr:hypothetical protein [Chryseobacterium soli]
MMRFRLFLTVLLSSTSYMMCFGQHFTIEELQKFNTVDMSTFKQEIKKQDYTFYDKTESNEFLLNEYDSPDFQYKIGKFEYKNDPSQNMIQLEFKDKKEYDQYEETVKKVGYKPSGTGKIFGGETYIDYVKQKSRIRLVSPKKDLPNEPYTILVFN